MRAHYCDAETVTNHNLSYRRCRVCGRVLGFIAGKAR